MGSTSGKQMLKALKPHFKVDTYDLLRKNCNSFSDCALFYLLDVRLEPKYRDLEKLGAAAEKNTGLVQSVTGGEYQPNPSADGFDLEKLMKKINDDKCEFGSN